MYAYHVLNEIYLKSVWYCIFTCTRNLIYMFDVHAYADFFGLYWNFRNEINLYSIK